MLHKGTIIATLAVIMLTGLIDTSKAQTGLDLGDVDFIYIGAHPDDELLANATMARYALDQGCRGTVITLTRGEGGGNATGPELGPALGIIRSEELRRTHHETTDPGSAKRNGIHPLSGFCRTVVR